MSLIFATLLLTTTVPTDDLKASTARHRDVHEITLPCPPEQVADRDVFFEVDAQVDFTRPDGSEVTVDAFYDGESTWKARAYCDRVGPWRWRSRADVNALSDLEGGFEVVPSDLPGKLRQHPDDPHQFAWDNGNWFLHLGDTGYRYVVATEPEWRAYIDQAVEAGFTKIRTWFCQSRGGVEALVTDDRSGLNLPYWREIDRRLHYALKRYPDVQFQLIPYGEDTAELRCYADGDMTSQFIARYAQARFSALPNIHWCISNDRNLTDDPSTAGSLQSRSVRSSTIDQIGRDMACREPWGTLLTNHQRRFTGYDFAEAPWSDIVTLEDLDQVDGAVILNYRQLTNDPVVNDEDRYELYRAPEHPAYFFRRLMWASLLSGGHATYCGLQTYLPFESTEAPTGVQGYQTAVADGRLQGGARDFPRIAEFFLDADLTLVGFEPDDDIVGTAPNRFKACRDKRTILIYAANPTHDDPSKADASEGKAVVSIELPTGWWTVKWFDPRTGRWQTAPVIQAQVGGGNPAPLSLESPWAGDVVLLLRRAEERFGGAPRDNAKVATQTLGRFRLGQSDDRHHLISPDGRPLLILGVNHVGAVARDERFFRDQYEGRWSRFAKHLDEQLDDWGMNCIGYGAPASLQDRFPYFASMSVAPIEKHRSEPGPDAPNGYVFPDVFDPDWQEQIREQIADQCRRHRANPMLVGYLWTDTPTWDLHKTRALRGTEWVSAIRELPFESPGRQRYNRFLKQRYARDLPDLNTIYGLSLSHLDDLDETDLSQVAIGRHIVQEDDARFLALIARTFYDVVGTAHREHDPDHLVFGDRYLVGDAPTSVLRAAAPWIDAVAVQVGDRYTPLYPPSTRYPARAIRRLHRITGKPVLICDHAISYPEPDAPRTIFEQVPDEAEAVAATDRFLAAALSEPFVVGYLRCQYIDRPASYGRGLRQGLLRADGMPRQALLDVYTRRFRLAVELLDGP